MFPAPVYWALCVAACVVPRRTTLVASSGVSEVKQRVPKSNNMVIGGDQSDDTWRELDEQVRSATNPALHLLCSLPHCLFAFFVFNHRASLTPHSLVVGLVCKIYSAGAKIRKDPPTPSLWEKRQFFERSVERLL